jgi:Ca2+-binding RTX toxin-like protein
MPTYNGTAGNDTLTGDSVSSSVTGYTPEGYPIVTITYYYADELNGYAGNDLLSGGYGHDTVSGGDGNDTLYGCGNSNYPDGTVVAEFNGEPVAYSYGSQFDDDDILYGGSGNDVIYGDGTYDSGNDALFGDDGNDTLFGQEGNDTLQGGSGLDVLNGGAGADTLSTGDGDTLKGDAGSDYLSYQGSGGSVDGGADDDYVTVNGSISSAKLKGGSGTDTINFYGVTLDGFSAANGFERLDTNYNQLSGTSAANSLDLSGLAATTGAVVYGQEGDDTLTGTAGNDTLQGGSGLDVLNGSAGDDTLSTSDGDTLRGDAGSDYLSYQGSGGSVDGGADDDFVMLNGSIFSAKLMGGSGTDTINFYGVTLDSFSAANGFERLDTNYNQLSGTSAANSLDLSGLAATTGAVVYGQEGDDKLTGTAGNDTLQGNAGKDSLLGGGGNDNLSGNDSGNADSEPDTLAGGAGDDTLVGGGGGDVLKGDAGSDYIVFRGSGGSVDAGADDDYVEVTGSIDPANLKGGSGIDTITFTFATLDSFSSANGFERLGPYGNYVYGTGTANALDFSGLALTNVGVDARGQEGDDTLIGTAGNDTLQGNAGKDSLLGDGGNDNLSGNDSGNADSESDTLTGGAGDDTLVGGGGGDVLKGEAGSDYIVFRGSGGSVDAGADDDYVEVTGSIDPANLKGGSGTDTITFTFATLESFSSANSFERLSQFGNYVYGTAGANVLDFSGLAKPTPGGIDARGQEGSDTIIGTTGDDFLQGNAGKDSLIGGDGNDNLAGNGGGNGDAESDTLTGGAGSDTLVGGGGGDVLKGDAGNDYIVFWGTGGSVDAGADDDYVEVAGSIDPASLKGGNGTDTITFSFATLDSFSSANGFERLSQFGNYVYGTAGANVLDFSGLAKPTSGGIYVYGQEGNDTITGTNGSDTLDGGADNDVMNGGDGSDRLDGGELADTLNGGNGVDALNGDAGNDVLRGDAGNDSLTGGDGNDNLSGGLGDDYMIGGAGSDTVSYITATGGITLDLALAVAQNTVSAGMDRVVQIENVRGSAYADTFRGNAATNSINAAEGNDTVYGLGGNDTLTGGTGTDTLYGGDSQDTIFGGDDGDLVFGDAGLDNLKGDAGNDTIHGGTENDTINGGTGDDVLYGDGGRDVLLGDVGADRFVYTAATESPVGAGVRDQIRDFSTAQGDKIDLSAIDAVTGSEDDSFTFIGSAAFTGAAGQLNVIASGSSWLVQGDLNGDQFADFAIQVTSSVMLTAADFVL